MLFKSKKVCHNCYYCIKAPLLFYTRFFGTDIFHIKCIHEGSTNSSELQEAPVYKMVFLTSCTTLLVFAIYTLFVAFTTHSKDVYFYIGLVMNSTLGLMTSVAGALSYSSLQNRRVQIILLTNLLKNVKYYGTDSLINHKSSQKIRASVRYYFSFITFHIISVMIFNLMLSNFTFLNISLRVLLYVGGLTFMAILSNFAVDTLIFQEIMGNCYDKIQSALVNRNNYTKIEEELNFANVNNVKYVSLEERLVKLRKLLLAIYDNLTLYFHTSSKLISFITLSYMLWLILTCYATVDLILHPVIWKNDKEYCLVLISTHMAVFSVYIALKRVENIKKPVSLF